MTDPKPLTNPSKQRFDEFVKTVVKELGDGAIMSMDNMPNADVPIIQTGSLALDNALGVGGIPCGRITEIFGMESVGKSTLALSIVAEAQKLHDGEILYIDAENALDLSYAKALGCDTQALYLSQLNCAEEALNTLCYALKNSIEHPGTTKLIIVDSVAALTPRSELDGEMQDVGMAVQARLMSKAMRVVANLANRSGVATVFVNQQRVAIGTWSPSGKPVMKTTGGSALPYWASIRIEMARRELEKGESGGDPTGAVTRIKVIKNKLAPPFREALVTIKFGRGFDRSVDAFESGVASGVITKAGNSYSFGDVKLAVGKDNVIAVLEGDERMREDIRISVAASIRGKRGLSVATPGVTQGDEAEA